MSNIANEFLIKDIRPGSKNINVVVIVLEISKWLAGQYLFTCMLFQSLNMLVLKVASATTRK